MKWPYSSTCRCKNLHPIVINGFTPTSTVPPSAAPNIKPSGAKSLERKSTNETRSTKAKLSLHPAPATSPKRPSGAKCYGVQLPPPFSTKIERPKTHRQLHNIISHNPASLRPFIKSMTRSETPSMLLCSHLIIHSLQRSRSSQFNLVNGSTFVNRDSFLRI